MIQADYNETAGSQSARRLRGLMAVSLLLLGFYLPTSIGSNFSRILYALSFLLSLGIFGLLMFRTKDAASVPECLGALLVVPILLVFTATSPLHGSAYGALVLYGVLSVMMMLNLRDVRLPAWSGRLLNIVNVVNFIIGLAILLGIQSIDQLVIQFYTTSKDYADLVPSMLLVRKPVLSFGTHSLAAFFFYLFFYMNWEAYRALGKKKFLGFAIGYLLMTGSLVSVTGVFLATLGLGQVLLHLWSVVRMKSLWALGALALVGFFFAFPPSSAAIQNARDAAQAVVMLTTSTSGGFGGRLAAGGTLDYNIRYIRAHPFGPVGVSNSPTLLFVDSGWVEYMLRGSVPLLVVIYGSLYLFLKRSLLSKADRLWLFAVILAFELGFTSLTYQRMLCLLPFAVIFLNDVRRSQQNALPFTSPGPG
jgi:hypothetical protein